MVTLLLTFFVLLLTLAEEQDPILFERGRDSFIDSLEYVGLGMLFGRSNVPHLGDRKIKYSTENPDESAESRTIDASAEELRRLREMLRKYTIIMPSPVIAERIDYSIANIHFPVGHDDLDESAKKFLRGFCRDLQQQVSRKHVILYVLGLASEERTEKERWMISARRAKAVADFLRVTLSSTSEADFQTQQGVLNDPSKYTIYSWGAGSGGGWVDDKSPFSERAQILIAVLRRTD